MNQLHHLSARRMISILVLALLMGILSSCQPATSTTVTTTSMPANTTTTAANETTSPDEQPVYPLDTNVTLTFWTRNEVSKTHNNFAETPLAQKLAEKTGVMVEYIHPPIGQEKESFNILLASGTLPDILYTAHPFDTFYSGGGQKAFDDGLIIQLNDVFEQFCPNLSRVLADDQLSDKLIKTDEGNYFTFPFIRGDKYLYVFQGPIIRQDWLTDLGLERPTTINEWEMVLTRFKEDKNAEAPLCFGGFGSGAFVGAYGVFRGFYQENNQVKYGPVESAYKDFLLKFRQWYVDGLLDKNMFTLDNPTLAANILGGIAGATIGNTGSGIGKWMAAAQNSESVADSFLLAAAPYPTLNKGDKPKFGQLDNPASGVAVITTSCQSVEIAARFLDYGYSEDGYMLLNFGIEGVSYEMVNGYPTYTDAIMKPEGLSITEAMSQYIKGNSGFLMVQDRRYMEQYSALDVQKESIEIWMNTDMDRYKLPPVTPTTDENAELSKILSDINTYESEMFVKFITGLEPIDNFDAYVSQIRQMKIERALEIYQNALVRFNNR